MRWGEWTLGIWKSDGHVDNGVVITGSAPGKQGDAGAKPMDNAGKGLSVMELFSAKPLSKQGLDMGDTGGASGEKDRINPVRLQAGSCQHVIDAVGNLPEIFAVDVLELQLAELFADAQIPLRKADPGLLLVGKPALGAFYGLKQEVAEVVINDVFQVLNRLAIVGTAFDHADMLSGLPGP